MDTIAQGKRDLRALLQALGHTLPRTFETAGIRHRIECQGCSKEWWITFPRTRKGLETMMPQLGERCANPGSPPKLSDSTILRQKRKERGAETPLVQDPR